MDNKELIEALFAELAQGNGAPFVAAMADDFTWHMKGSTAWSGTYAGKEAVQRDLLGPLYAQFASPYRNTAERFIADGDHVVVLCRGDVETKTGARYANDYCFVIRVEDGQMRELTEYLDTALVNEAFTAPAAPGSPAPQRWRPCRRAAP